MSEKNEEKTAPRKKSLLKSYLDLCKNDSTHLYGFIGVVALVLTVISLALPFVTLRPEPLPPINPKILANEQEAKMDELRKKNILSLVKGELNKKTEIIKETKNVQAVENLPEIENTGFSISSYIVIFDMRKWEKVPSVMRNQKCSPVTQKIMQTIKKDESNPPIYRLKSSTSGVGIDSKSITHQDHMTIYKTIDEKNSIEPRGEQTFVKSRVMEFDVSQEPRTFTLETLKTFWNAFQNKDEQLWAGLNVPLETGYIRLVIIFPETMPYKEGSLQYIELLPNGKQKPKEPNTDYILADEKDRLWAVWDIIEPKKGYGYNIKWDWEAGTLMPYGSCEHNK